MNLYSTLLKVLDQIRKSAPPKNKSYNPNIEDKEKINYARSKAFIHLYLKVKFNIVDFENREIFITDGINDAGIDGYYIDRKNFNIYLIQSKFRTSEKNFQEKEIELKEILSMEIRKVLSGEEFYENGTKFNGKILRLIRNIQELENIGRYKYKVIVLANLGKVPNSKLKLLTDNLPVEVFDFKKCYNELLFPVITGTSFDNVSLNIQINLSDKSAGGRLNYNVETKNGNCLITILFIPTIEIAKLINRYKNSILKYNPRSFLALEKGSLNLEISKTLIENASNEFALYNNGLTILSDETYFNERIGKKNKAQLHIKNPQIINGGQTAFTLHSIYESKKNDDSYNEIFKGKEVLAKIITFEKTVSSHDEDNKQELIKIISDTSNKQTTVTYADRLCNSTSLLYAQKRLFNEHSILIERKNGEFYDGIKSGIIDSNEIISRNLILRLISVSRGELFKGRKPKFLLSENYFAEVFTRESNFRKYYFSTIAYIELFKLKETIIERSANEFNCGKFALLSVVLQKYDENLSDDEFKDFVQMRIRQVIKRWKEFEVYAISKKHNEELIECNFNFGTQVVKVNANWIRYYKNMFLPIDLNDFFFDGKKVLLESENARNQIKKIESSLTSIKGVGIEKIKEIIPLINRTNYFNEDRINEISEKVKINKEIIVSIIKVVTSGKLGYYFYQKYK